MPPPCTGTNAATQTEPKQQYETGSEGSEDEHADSAEEDDDAVINSENSVLQLTADA